MSEIEEANPDVPYRAEYAKSGRASCRGCKESIEKGTLRLAVLVQSPMFDGKMPMWYHYMCFFSKQHPKAVGDIAHFEELQFEDQEKIRKQIAKFGADGASSSTTNGDAKKAKKRPKAAVKKDLKNVFVIEYAKSSRAHCRGCEEKIVKGEIRVSKKDFESDEGRRFGGMDRWHHLVCFGKMRAELGFYHCGDTLPGFEDLNKEDKATVKKALPEIKPVEGSDAVDGEAPAKKVKLEKGADEETKKKEKEDKKKLKKQSDDLFKMKDMVKDLKKVVKSQILEYNEQEIPVGEDRILERLVDCMTFGKLLPCEKCKTGQFVFRSGVGYQCTGSVSEWVKCEYVYVNPPRVPFKIPEEIIEKIAESKEKKIADISKKLAKYKCSVHDRIIQFNEKTVPVKKEEEEASGSKENAGPKLKLDRKLPFKGMDFFIYKFTKERKDLKIAIERLGGSVASTLHDEIAAVISTEEEVEKCHSKIQDAKDLGIQVVSVDFIEKCKNLDDAVDKIVEYSISPWGDDPKKRVDKSRQNKSEMKSMKYGKSIYEKSGKSSKVKYKVESGTAVEPESGLVDIAHVYKSGNDIYTVTLGLTDIQTNKNSFYKLQLLESNSSNKKYWLFRAWGRIGTKVGGTKVDSFNSDLSEAKKLFCIQYEDKTGNLWCNHKNFQKIPGKMYPLSVDYGESSDTQVEKLDATNSKLKKPIQDLIMMIFNLDLMKKTMIEFEINLDEMPLGRISKSQMKEAYLVLTELQNFINQKGEDIKPNQKQLILEATNRFYTFVPHNFGIKAPPLLDNLDIIKQKIEMLDSLLEMEFAYEVMQSSQKGGEHTLDAHYAKLNADIDVVEPDCKEFEIIQNYVKNTHAETHSNYELEILDAFKINRKEEEKRFKPFKKLPNRKLLWHGSRLTNFAGILSQGLRIAPPEAPVTGYMFGKGLYFADMVSKSANYCMTSPNNNVGLLLLCDVALGTMYERPHADYIEKLPSGFHSTKGLGHTSPDPKQCATLDDGVEVPFGKPVKSAKKNTSLLYNEYIVYDVAQVKAKYLVKMEFKYKY